MSEDQQRIYPQDISGFDLAQFTKGEFASLENPEEWTEISYQSFEDPTIITVKVPLEDILIR